MSDKSFQLVMKSALTLLSRKDYTQRSLAQKLENKGYSAHDIERACHQLVQWEYLDDLRYAKQYIARKYKNYGNAYIKMKLALLGVDSGIIQRILSEYPQEQQRDMAVQLVYKRMHILNDGLPIRAQQCQKIYQMLIRRGYSCEDAQYALEVVNEGIVISSSEFSP